MDDTVSLLQVTPFQPYTLYVTFSKHVKWRLSCTIMTYTYFDKSKWKHGDDTSMAQDAYLLQTHGLLPGFRGFKLSSNFEDSCFFGDFGTSYVALFNGLMISDIRILVLQFNTLSG